MNKTWIECLETHVKKIYSANKDGSHDFGHVKRVANLAINLAKEEKGDELVVLTAALLHDIVSLPKDDPQAKQSSLFSAKYAENWLSQIEFPKQLISQVSHAIHAHSFSANIEPETIEAKALQDADRMEALGALGLMRIFYNSGKMGSSLMHPVDPEGRCRLLDDKKFALDHFPLKLLKLQPTMKTESGRKIALSRSLFLENFRKLIIQDKEDNSLQSSRFAIAHTYQTAGMHLVPLFDPDDPFAQIRSIADKSYALDSLLKIDDPYIKEFIIQLKHEINEFR